MRAMANLRLALVLAALAALPAAGSIADPLIEKKAATVRERPFQYPFDFKSESDFKLGTPSTTPTGLVPHREAKKPFVGLGLTRPLEPGK